MHVDFPFVYATKFINRRGGISERKRVGLYAFDVKEASPSEVELLMTWSVGGLPGRSVPASAIRWNGRDYVSLSHVDPRSCVVRSDLPVGETHQRGDPYRFLALYTGVGALEEEDHALHQYLSGHGGILAKSEGPSPTSSNRQDVERDVLLMAENLLIVGDVVFQRVSEICVRVSRTFARHRPYLASLSFTKFGFEPVVIEERVLDFGSEVLRSDCMTFSVEEFEAVKESLGIDYEQVFQDLTVVDHQKSHHNNEIELLMQTVRATLLLTSGLLGTASSTMISGWNDLRDMMGGIDGDEAYPIGEILGKLDRVVSDFDDTNLKALSSRTKTKIEFYQRLGR